MSNNVFSALLLSFALSIGCGIIASSIRESRRFEPVPSVGNMAVDTRTGQLCWLYDPLLKAGEKEALFPLCKDIK